MSAASKKQARNEDKDSKVGSVEAAEMRKTLLGQSWMLVESVLRCHKEEVTLRRNRSVLPLAVDDLVYMAERLLRTQSKFRSEGKPADVDIGYHYTSTECIGRIKYDGLLSRPERHAKGINVVHHGSAFGEGVYVANDPFAHARFGNVGVMVVRLPGSICDLTRRPSRIERSGSDSRRFRDFLVLNESNQCLPALQYNKDAVLNDPQSVLFLYSCHIMIQRIFARNLNQNDLAMPLLHDWLKWQQSSGVCLVVCEPTRTLPSKIPPPPSFPMPRTVTSNLTNNATAMGSCRMTTALSPATHCAGHAKEGTMVVCYTVPRYNFTLMSYFPDTHWGKSLVKRLQYAFLGGFTFSLVDKTEATPQRVKCCIAHNTKLSRKSWKKLIHRANQQLDAFHVPPAHLLMFGGTLDPNVAKSPPKASRDSS